MVVGKSHFISRPGIADLCVECYLALVAFGAGYLIVGLKLAATDIFGKTVVGMCFFKHVIVIYKCVWNFGRDNRVERNVGFNIEECTELEHVGLILAFAIRQA